MRDRFTGAIVVSLDERAYRGRCVHPTAAQNHAELGHARASDFSVYVPDRCWQGLSAPMSLGIIRSRGPHNRQRG